MARAKGRYSLFAIPVANPEKTALQFPPTGDAYAKNTESHYLWRWLGAHAPDLVIIVGADPAHLAEALASNQVAGVGTIPARVVAAKPGFLKGLGVTRRSRGGLRLPPSKWRISLKYPTAMNWIKPFTFPPCR